MDNRNCREYCRFAKCCYANGEPGRNPYDCPNAWRIEEILDDERYDRDEETEVEDEQGAF